MVEHFCDKFGAMFFETLCRKICKCFWKPAIIVNQGKKCFQDYLKSVGSVFYYIFTARRYASTVYAVVVW